ncbi:MAG: hypothetical protein M3Q60_14160 [Actinomycetota bacterium]|nr:hypothetical protein [Actinomycetota bacterium]
MLLRRLTTRRRGAWYGELLERWRRSQGIGRDVIAQRAGEARARLLEARE